MAVTLISGETEKDYPVELIGGKAKGLIALKWLVPQLTSGHSRVEVPDFFVIPCGYDLNNMGEILEQAEPFYRFAVRSSSPFEDGLEYSFDGIFDTCLDVDSSGLREAIETVMASAQGSKARQYAKDFGLTIDDRLAVIIQRMAYGGEDGVIYSKFPASASITKIISWRDEENRFFTILRRNDAPEGLRTAGEVIEGGGINIEIAGRLAGISYTVEGNFGFPVRIEYTMARHPEEIYLL